ncbi:hypothetical protein H6P81_021724 [Aristolochia fimbriata]|uniref:Uncharacterized protein n=1 Tax=Aristolochia fimbriata TaxID=158543 RepID=A0AAV7DP63_ARIFI|nr:hypothetical protein H6P81_021724 [Aristolochia fimbriata]
MAFRPAEVEAITAAALAVRRPMRSKSTEPYHFRGRRSVVTRFPWVNLRKDHCRFRESAASERGAARCPAADGGRDATPVESLRLALATGADGGSASAATFVAGRGEHLNNHSAIVPSERSVALANPANHRVFEHKLPEATRSGYTCLGVTPGVFSPPRALLPHRGGRSSRRGEQIRPCPPLARLAEKHFAPRAPGLTVVAPPSQPLRGFEVGVRGHGSERDPRGGCLRDPEALLSDATPGQVGTPAEFKAYQ